ncbi:hypothetical protein AB0F91_23225 [Amycolatopsis sp. NPDC023774]
MADGEISSYVDGGRGGPGGGSSEITEWVATNFAPTVGGTTVYDLTK